MFDQLKSDKYKIKKEIAEPIYSTTSFKTLVLAWENRKKLAVLPALLITYLQTSEQNLQIPMSQGQQNLQRGTHALEFSCSRRYDL
jgi:hypothetical protein